MVKSSFDLEEFQTIKNERGRKTYEIGRPFLDAAGIKGALDTTARACADETDPWLLFWLDDNHSMPNYLLLSVQAGKISVDYRLDLTEFALDTREVLWKFVEKATKKTIYQSTLEDNVLRLSSNDVQTNDYKSSAKTLGEFHRMMSLYLDF